MFLEVSKYIGTVKTGEKQIIEFPYENINKFGAITLHCGCTDAVYDEKKKVLRVTYDPVYPNHLKLDADRDNKVPLPITTHKKIDVVYYGTDEIQRIANLTFQATVII